jgi:hypothetical protein
LGGVGVGVAVAIVAVAVALFIIMGIILVHVMPSPTTIATTITIIVQLIVMPLSSILLRQRDHHLRMPLSCPPPKTTTTLTGFRPMQDSFHLLACHSSRAIDEG